jgi:hypothetical protein
LNIKKYFKELKIKKYEIKFKHQQYNERSLKPEIKIAQIIYFYDKNNFNCLCISKTHVTVRKENLECSRPFNHFLTNVEEKNYQNI